jgi:D-tagatose-1,6-bisphosphate aldolase subunit GatZ/KbaZ
VNQFGGYTGMLPIDYKNFVYEIAENLQFPLDKIILGGDHLGPLTWQNDYEVDAMKKSEELILQYVKSGFTKIHIDTSMKVADDDKNTRLSDETIARRAAQLCKVAENAKGENSIVYVIGSEVPIPGGAIEEEETLQVTSVSDFEKTVEIFKNEFYKNGLEQAWENVVGVVVQPGVEFGDDAVHEYDREKAQALCSSAKKYKGIVFEGHSTDYQTKYKLKEMVEDGIAILKVGPALTFAMREGLFALELIEKEIFASKPYVKLSNFKEVLEGTMLDEPKNWINHYHGSRSKIGLSRKYSYSDRCRYYLPNTNVDNAIKNLLSNLNSEIIPLTLISQYMPNQYANIRCCGEIPTAEFLLKDRIKDLIKDYRFAIIPN